MGLWHGGYGERDCRVWVLGSGIYEVGSHVCKVMRGGIMGCGLWGGAKVVWVQGASGAQSGMGGLQGWGLGGCEVIGG